MVAKAEYAILHKCPRLWNNSFGIDRRIIRGLWWAVVFNLYLIKQAATLPFIIAVMLSVWYGGVGPGVVACVLAAAASGWILAPKHSLNTLVESALGMGFFLVVTQAIAKIYEGHKKT